MFKTTRIVWLIVIAVIIVFFIYYSQSHPKYANIISPRPEKGNPKAEVVIEEFSDFQCPACAQASQAIAPLIKKWQQKVNFIYRYFPLILIHSHSYQAALAAECANDQGKFWEYHDLLFSHQQDLSDKTLLQLAATLPLDQKSFAACYKSKAKASVVNADIAEGERRNITATPSFFINGKYVPDWRALPALLEAQFGVASTTSNN